MAVENTAHGVGDGLVEIVAFDEHGEQSGDGALAELVSRTFHGRDVFAPVASWLSTGIATTEFGREIKDFISFSDTKPKHISENILEAQIMHIDRFGNLITNLQKKDLPNNFSLEVNGTIIKKHLNFYAEAEKDEIFTIFGSADFLEIVANQNSAKDLLKVRTGEKITVKTT